MLPYNLDISCLYLSKADDWGSFIKIFYIIPVLHLKWWSKYTYYTALFQKKWSKNYLGRRFMLTRYNIGKNKWGSLNFDYFTEIYLNGLCLSLLNDLVTVYCREYGYKNLFEKIK